MDIYGVESNFKSILDNSISVPVYQRSYSWGKKEVEQFIEDVFSSAAEHKNHFWGPIVYLQQSDNHEIEIVDGQQRISTAMIMLALLRDEIYGYDLPEGHNNYEFLMPIFAEMSPSPNTPRFRSSNSINPIFADYIFPDITSRPLLTKTGAKLSKGEKKDTKKLRAAYFQIQERLKEKIEGLASQEEQIECLRTLLKALTKNFQIFKIVITNEKDAYTLFESLNARGRPLDPSDLLKTLFLKTIGEGGDQPEKIEDALKVWEEISTNIGRALQSTFFRHYLLTVQSEKVKKSDIYELFALRLEGKSVGTAKGLLNTLKIASVQYGPLISKYGTDEPGDVDKSIYESCQMMNIYHESHRFFVLGVIQSEADIGLKQQLVRAVEALTFRWDLKGKNAQELESFLQEQVNKLRENSTLRSVEAILADMKRVTPIDEDISDSYREQNNNLQRYLLYRIERTYGVDPSSSLQLEHLAPQNPSDNSNWYEVVAPEVPDDDSPDYESYCKSFGNVTLLERRLNPSIGNAEWEIKVGRDGKPGLSASQQNITHELINEKKWTKKHIENRGKWMMECAKVLTGSDWVKTGQASIPKLKF